MIADGELARGRRMQQDMLAERFNTSITPVREALRLLEAEGLLVSEPHRGVRVAEANYDRVKTVYQLRRLVEPYAMRRAARRLSARDLDSAAEMLDAMEDAAARGHRQLLSDTNRHFHFQFYSRAGNAGLTDEIELLWQQFPWDVLQVVTHRAAEVAREHQEILAAARAGDGEALARATESHLSRSFLGLARHLTGQDVADPFDIDVD